MFGVDGTKATIIRSNTSLAQCLLACLQVQCPRFPPPPAQRKRHAERQQLLTQSLGPSKKKGERHACICPISNDCTMDPLATLLDGRVVAAPASYGNTLLERTACTINDQRWSTRVRIVITINTLIMIRRIYDKALFA